MAGKAGGRLTFSGRQEYVAVPIYDDTKTILGYAAICTCPLGNHYLAPESGVWNTQSARHDAIVERTVTPDTQPFAFPYRISAQAAIEQWQWQHDAAQTASGESEG